MHPISSFFGPESSQRHQVARVVTMGAAGPATLSVEQNAAWTGTLLGLADQIDNARSVLDANAGFLVEAKALAGAVPGLDDIWTADKAQTVADADGMAAYASVLLRDAANGVRTIFLQSDGQWAIEKLAADPYTIDTDPATGLPALYKNGVVSHAPGTLALGALAIGAIVVGTVAIWGLVTWMIRGAVDGAVSIVERASDAYSKKLLFNCLDKPNSAQCAPGLKALQDQQVAVFGAEANKKGTPSGADAATVSVTKYLVIGAAVVGGTYALVKLVPPLLEERKASRKAAA